MNFSPDSQIPSNLKYEAEKISSYARQAYEVQQSYRHLLPQEAVETLVNISSGLLRLSQQTNRWKEEQDNLVALSEVSQAVNSSLELDEVLRIVMDTIVRLTGAERGFLMLKGEDNQLAIRIARNWEQESIDSTEFAVSRSVIGRVVTDGEPILTTNASEDPRFDDKESIIIHNMRSIMCVPLQVKAQLIGVIYADNRFRSGIFSDRQLNLLATFANQAAIAIENARLFESVRKTLEEVTELKNLMDNVFASIASGVITTDLSEQVTLFNQAATVILGDIHRDLTGQNLRDLIPIKTNEDLQIDLYQKLEQVHTTGKQITGVEINTKIANRGPVILSLNLSPLKNATQETQGVAIVVDDLTEKKRLEAQRRLFERMVSPAVIDQLNPDQLQLGGKRTNISVLFADIRGFTGFSENLDPIQLVSILNFYLAAAAEAILAYEGTIDKFLGDAVMAWFNAPIAQPDHAMRAVKAALDIRKAIENLQTSLPANSKLSFGVGIHYGEAVLGLIGTQKRLDYTAIGDCVNTAKRIQENSNAGQILVSAPFYQLIVGQVIASPVNPLYAKGKSLPVEAFEIISLKE